MKKAWHNISKVFFSFQRSDRNAILILGVIIALVFLSIRIINQFPQKTVGDFSELKAMIEEWERTEVNKKSEIVLFDFDPNTVLGSELDSLSIPKKIKHNLLSYRKAGGIFKSAKDVRKIYGMNDSLYSMIEDYIVITKPPDLETKKKKERKDVKPIGSFDPNTAGKSDLVNFGFSNYQASNLIKYRDNGGVYSQPSDILSIYGIDSVFFLSVVEYIEIVELKSSLKPEPTVLIELNSADTIELKKLPGIGTSFANRIIKYRNLLGGYYSKTQLLEVYNFPEETYLNIQQSIYVDTLTVTKMRLNFAEYSDLIKHPYMGKVEVKAILDYRQTQGAIKNISELGKIESFDSEMITKIRPYFTCQ